MLCISAVYLRRLLFIFPVLALTGCGLVRDEFEVSGGFVSPLADRTILASSQREQADRYVLAALLLAPLALDTSGDATESRATADRVNQLYRSMSELYEAIKKCSPGVGNLRDCRDIKGNLTSPNGYSFEALSYEVQSDLYFVARNVVANLDLNEEVSDLIGLRPSALAGLADAISDLLPVARKAAATYRDGIVILADAVSASCVDDQVEVSKECKRLNGDLAILFNATSRSNSTEMGNGRLSNLLGSARKVAEKERWMLDIEQFSAIISHIDRACKRAYNTQRIELSNDGISINCGEILDDTNPSGNQQTSSPARDAFLKSVTNLELVTN